MILQHFTKEHKAVLQFWYEGSLAFPVAVVIFGSDFLMSLKLGEG